jgi:hypothetical protein
VALLPAEGRDQKKPSTVPAPPGAEAKALVGREKVIAELGPARGKETVPAAADAHAKFQAIPRADLDAARQARKAPPPPQVKLAVSLRNDGPGALFVELGGERFAWWVSVSGPGVVRVPAPAGEGHPFGKARRVTVPAGQELTLKLDRLLSRVDGRAWYTYCTVPGDYRITASARVLAAREPEMRRAEWLTLRSQPVTFRVEGRR